MQYSHILYLKKASQNTVVTGVVKAVILLAIIYYLVVKLEQENHLHQRLILQVYGLFSSKSLLAIALPVILMPVNWYLEAIKWQLLASKVERLSITQAMRGILTGLSLAFITPRALGDYAGRIWQMSGEKRSRATGAIMLGRMAQFLCTIGCGMLGTGFVLARQPGINNSGLWVILGVVFLFCTLIILVIIFARKNLVVLIQKISGEAVASYFQVISVYSRKEICILLFLSMARYFTFAFQFLWILYLFQIGLPSITLFAGITWIFIAKSIIPAFNFLNDLGVREFSALYFFSDYGIDNASIVVASLVIWIINIFFPTLAGAFFIIRMKIFKA